MTTSICNKKIRIEQFNVVQDSKNAFEKLLPGIIYAISSYLNIMDARCMTNVCRNFKLIPSHYFHGAHNQLQRVFYFCCRSSNKKTGLDFFSESWRLGFENALPFLKEFVLLGRDWDLTRAVPENQMVSILSLAKSLETLDLFYCSEKILNLISSFNLTELNISISYDLDFSLLNKSLKNLSVTYDQKKLSLINFNNKTPPLANLETLAITAETDNASLDDNFIIFVQSLTSLKKLTLQGLSIFLNVQNLKNLKEFILYKSTLQVKVMNLIGYPTSLEILTIHNIAFNTLDVKDFHNNIISLANLKKVNLIFYDDRDSSSIETLRDSEIAALDKVYIKFDHSNTFLKKYDFCIKHLSLNFYLYNAIELDQLNIKFINLEELEAICAIPKSTVDRKIIIGDEQISYNEYRLIFGLDLFSDNITSILEDEDFVWTKSMLVQLRRKPLMKCTSLTGRFVYEDETHIPTTELLSLFPNLTSEKINRSWYRREKIMSNLDH